MCHNFPLLFIFIITFFLLAENKEIYDRLEIFFLQAYEEQKLVSSLNHCMKIECCRQKDFRLQSLNQTRTKKRELFVNN